MQSQHKNLHTVWNLMANTVPPCVELPTSGTDEYVKLYKIQKSRLIDMMITDTVLNRDVLISEVTAYSNANNRYLLFGIADDVLPEKDRKTKITEEQVKTILHLLFTKEELLDFGKRVQEVRGMLEDGTANLGPNATKDSLVAYIYSDAEKDRDVLVNTLTAISRHEDRRQQLGGNHMYRDMVFREGSERKLRVTRDEARKVMDILLNKQELCDAAQAINNARRRRNTKREAEVDLIKSHP